VTGSAAGAAPTATANDANPGLRQTESRPRSTLVAGSGVCRRRYATKKPYAKGPLCVHPRHVRKLKGPIRAIAYVRVSTTEQAVDGASLEAQQVALEAEAVRRGWDVEVVSDSGFSAKSLNRPGLQSALARLDAGDADALLALRLDRLSRSVVDFAGLLARARKRHWRLVMLSPDLDTEDAAGKFTAHVLAAAAEYERDLIGARTREGMEQRRAEGVHLGRAPVLPLAVVERVVAERDAGTSIRVIARSLTADAIPTARGGAVWSPSSVQSVLRSSRARSAHGAA
jgi:DNA invertase Pin-like site-specific DNA recombinase